MVEVNGRRLLFDVGRGTLSSLARMDIPITAIDRVFITHHHYDHIGELAELIISSWMEGRTTPVSVFGPPETGAIVETILGKVYDKDIEFRVAEGGCGDFITPEVTDVSAGKVYDDGEIRVYAEQVRHGDDLPFLDAFRQRWTCLGYRVEAEGKVVSISGDTIECPGVLRLAAGSDLHVQCCWMPTSRALDAFSKHVIRNALASSDTVGKIATQAGVKRLILTHFRRMDPGFLPIIETEVRADFSGELHLAQDLEEFWV
ncbi:MBL fold metallo-hydrolase [Shinella granuli]